MKKLLFAFVGLIGMGGVGYGGWTFLSAAPAPDEVAAIERPQFVRIDNLIIPVIRRDRVERHVSLSVALEVRDAENRRTVQRALPHLRHAFIVDLNGYLRMLKSEDNPRFLLTVKRRLLKVGIAVVGPGLIDAVLVQQSSERELL
ncbi:MAG: hypothetical protein HOH66_02595 [Rhodospirillaceae bacterium]|nr:hypothetical protein [Rhodospirillaceae bacterium]MBT6116737.1 hypothetical protein [Rhodospirillaceae bacterium]